MANTKAIIIGAVLVIIAVVVIMQSIGSLSTPLVNATDAVVEHDSCSDTNDAAGVPLYWNYNDGNTTNQCWNSSGVNTSTVGNTFDLPMETLFEIDGVLMIALMGGLLVLLTGLVIKRAFKK